MMPVVCTCRACGHEHMISSYPLPVNCRSCDAPLSELPYGIVSPERDQAVTKILYALRSPLVLMSIPDREEVQELAQKFNITAADLLERAVSRARNT